MPTFCNIHQYNILNVNIASANQSCKKGNLNLSECLYSLLSLDIVLSRIHCGFGVALQTELGDLVADVALSQWLRL